MKIDYRWKIAQLERRNEDNGVVTAHWECVGATEDHSISVRIYGSVDFAPDGSNPDFIPFDSLTEELVLSWIWNRPGDSDFKLYTEQQILQEVNKKMNPQTIPGIPW